MLDIIQFEDIKRYKRYISFDVNTNSRLYYDKDLIHKIFLYKTKDFDTILMKLDELKLEELVELRRLIFKNEFMVGYSIKNYKKYKSLNKFKNREFELKKEDCYKVVKAFDKLLKNNLSYVDFTTSNILLNKNTGNIKICDLDSLILNNSKLDEKSGLKNLLILILTYLYNINRRDIRNVITAGKNIEGTFIEECQISDNMITIDHLNNVIEHMKEEYIKKEKKLIIDKSWELINTGYPKFFIN